MVTVKWTNGCQAGNNNRFAVIFSHIFDYHASILEGSIGALPRRLMVAPEEESRAKYILDIARRELDAHNAQHDPDTEEVQD